MNEEYNRILQLVKSDCPNNRLLGFQLAKKLDNELFKRLYSGNDFKTLKEYQVKFIELLLN